MPPILSALRTSLASCLLACLLVLTLAACGGDGAEPASGGGAAISREAFVSTYVDLRLAALQDTTGVVTPDQRDSILGEHHVTSDDLLHFVEVHGGDIDFMRDVWNEVDEQIRTRHNAEDSVSS